MHMVARLYNFPSCATSCRLTSIISSFLTLIKLDMIRYVFDTWFATQNGYAAVLSTIFSGLFSPFSADSRVRHS